MFVWAVGPSVVLTRFMSCAQPGHAYLALSQHEHYVKKKKIETHEERVASIAWAWSSIFVITQPPDIVSPSFRVRTLFSLLSLSLSFAMQAGPMAAVTLMAGIPTEVTRTAAEIRTVETATAAATLTVPATAATPTAAATLTAPATAATPTAVVMATAAGIRTAPATEAIATGVVTRTVVVISTAAVTRTAPAMVGTAMAAVTHTEVIPMAVVTATAAGIRMARAMAATRTVAATAMAAIPMGM